MTNRLFDLDLTWEQLLESIKIRQVTPRALLLQCENDIIEATMLRCRYNQTRAAVALGISRGTLRTMLIKRFGNKYIANTKNKVKRGIKQAKEGKTVSRGSFAKYIREK